MNHTFIPHTIWGKLSAVEQIKRQHDKYSLINGSPVTGDLFQKKLLAFFQPYAFVINGDCWSINQRLRITDSIDYYLYVSCNGKQQTVDDLVSAVSTLKETA